MTSLSVPLHRTARAGHFGHGDVTTMSNEGFKRYRRSQIAELRPYVAGEDLDAIDVGPDVPHIVVSISAPDREAGSPKPGDMIARNPKNHADQWLVAAKYFADNFEAYEEDGAR